MGNELRQYKAKRAALKIAEGNHNNRMSKVAKSAGLTLDQLRALPKHQREETIFQHREAYNG